jgi:replication factor C subunit 2/4
MSSKPGVPKIILMDEADGLLAATQDALRNVMETYHSNCRFILTANNQSKIIDAIQSRCTIINFRTPPKEQVVRRLRFIIEAEKVDCSDVEAVVAKLIEMYYPSIRDMIKNLQKAHLVGKVTPASFKSLSAIDQEVYSLIISGKTLDARKKWIELGLVPEELVRNFFEIFIASPPSNLEVFQKAVLLFAETEKEFGLSCDREITLCGFAVRFSQIMKTGAALK